jgi:hypothetical protein
MSDEQAAEETIFRGRSKNSVMNRLTPAAESHGLWQWMNAPTFGRDVAPLGR